MYFRSRFLRTHSFWTKSIQCMFCTCFSPGEPYTAAIILHVESITDFSMAKIHKASFLSREIRTVAKDVTVFVSGNLY